MRSRMPTPTPNHAVAFIKSRPQEPFLRRHTREVNMAKAKGKNTKAAKPAATAEEKVSVNAGRYAIYHEWLKSNKGVDIPAEHLQIAVSSYGSFQRSDENKAYNGERASTREERAAARAEAAAAREQARADKQAAKEARAAEREATTAKKAAAKKAATPAAKASKKSAAATKTTAKTTTAKKAAASTTKVKGKAGKGKAKADAPF